jgi:Cytochrome c7 and related cytochrome c/Class III cytochrome C family
MRKLALFGAGSLLLALGATAVVQRSSTAQQAAPAKADTLAAWVLAKGDSANLKGPRQPVFFRHDIHAGNNKIPCQYCHYTVSVSSEPGIPSIQSCMGCHLVIGGSDSSHKVEIKKVRDSWNNKVPIEWVRIHTLARHVHFPHARHIKALGPNACQTCHGDVARMPQVFKVNNVNNMGFCITCHLERKINRDCTACHY